MAWHPFRNPGLKVAALGLGTLLWFTVSGQQLERSIRVPVEFRNVPASLEITGDLSENVFAHLRGVDNVISRIEPGDVRAVIDLADAHAVTRGTFALRTDQIVAPSGAEVMWVDPAQVTITLESSGALMLPVTPLVDGTPASGFVMGAMTVEPPTVEVVGPETQLKRLRAATTARISIEGATTTVRQTVSIGVPDASLRLREPQMARVTIQIVKGSDGRGAGRGGR